MSTVLKLNDEALGIVSGCCRFPGRRPGPSPACSRPVLSPLIALTKGPSGSRLFGRGVDLIHPGHPVETADTVGAGDAFTAALVTGMLRHKGWDEIGDRANRIAGYVCSRKGAWSELPAELASWTRP